MPKAHFFFFIAVHKLNIKQGGLPPFLSSFSCSLLLSRGFLSLWTCTLSVFINIMTPSPYCSPRYWISCFILIRWARALPRGTPGLLWPTFFGIKAHQPRWSDNRSFLPIRFSKLRCAGVQDVDDFEGKGILFRGIVRQKARARTCWIELVCLYDEAFDWPSTVESSVFAKAVT